MTPEDAGHSPVGEGRRPASPGGAGSEARGVPGRVTGVLGAVAAGCVVGVLGTFLHGHLLIVDGMQLPFGAVAALLLAGSLLLYCGLWARSIIMTALAGAVAYGVVALLSMSAKTVILTGSSEAAPMVALAGNAWLFGVLAMTLVAVAVGAVVLRPRSTRRRLGQ